MIFSPAATFDDWAVWISVCLQLMTIGLMVAWPVVLSVVGVVVFVLLLVVYLAFGTALELPGGSPWKGAGGVDHSDNTESEQAGGQS